MTAEVSFTKRAAAELSRRFNGLTVRSRGSSGSAPPAPTNPPVQPTSKGGQLTGWVVEGVKRQQQQRGNQNKRYDRISEYAPGRPRTTDELWLDAAFLARLFRYVPAVPDRGCAAQVCRAWRDVLYQPVFWTGVMPVLRCRELRANSGDLSSTSELRKKVYSSLQKRGFASLCLFGASDDDVFDVVSNFPAGYARTVRSLALRCCNATDKGHEVLLEFFADLARLEMSGCNEVTDAGLWASLHPRIQHLTLADCINVADESVAAIAQLLPNLRELNLQAYHVTDAALSFFGQGASLQALRLRSCWELTNHGLLNLVHSLPGLTVLSLSGCSKVTDDGVELLAENLRQLRSLDLSWCPRISDAALEYIACDLSLLEELTLDRCVHVTDIGVGYLSTMVSLRVLYLRWCSQIRDFGLQHLCSMRNLQVLSLAGCPLLTSNGLSSLVQLRDLRELELTNCAGTSEELFEYLHIHLPMCLVIE